MAKTWNENNTDMITWSQLERADAKKSIGIKLVCFQYSHVSVQRLQELYES